MFESLQQGLLSAIRTLRGRGKLTEANMREGLRLVEQALLEADVSYSVVKEFIQRVSQAALGEKVLKSLDPSQQVIGIVYQELVRLMGPVDHSLHLLPGVSILMLCGLQGSGKTTTCAKLGRLVRQKGRQPLLVAADLQRPAAIEQLQILGNQLNIPVYVEPGATDAVQVAAQAVKHAEQIGANVVILDTAGRLHVDQELMEELKRIDQRVQPQQVYLVVDAMTGQDAVHSAKAFNEALELDGVIMTKLDGDARGGAALSVKAVTGVPIKFIGVGEHLEDLEEFHPERMASRILGMGDIVTLFEQAKQKFDQEELQRQQERLRQGEFTLDDFKKMLLQTTRLGPLQKVLSLIPGFGSIQQMMEAMGQTDLEGDLRRVVGIIDSMTPEERRDPSIIDQSRRRRIAAGAGVAPHEVSELVRQFEPIAKVMRQLSGMSMFARMRKMQELIQGGMFDPMGRIKKEKIGTGKRLTTEEKKRLKKLREKEAKRRKWEAKHKKRE